MRAIATTRTEQETSLVVKAPQLSALVSLWFRARADPGDKSAHIQLRLLSHDGVDRCPSCETALSLTGYRQTRTRFVERESLSCTGCRTVYVLRERLFA